MTKAVNIVCEGSSSDSRISTGVHALVKYYFVAQLRVNRQRSTAGRTTNEILLPRFIVAQLVSECFQIYSTLYQFVTNLIISYTVQSEERDTAFGCKMKRFLRTLSLPRRNRLFSYYSLFFFLFLYRCSNKNV